MSPLPQQKNSLFRINNSHIAEIVAVGAIALILLSLELWNIRGELPFNAKPDEEIYVNNAAIMAATGNLNPRWFGNPGSTIIYPLMAVYKLKNIFSSAFVSDFYLLGRFLSLLYAVLTIPLVYSIGRTLYNKKVCVIAIWLLSLYPMYIAYSQTIRTDIAATFFCYLSIWLMLKLKKAPTLKNYFFVGAAIGLAVASRYFMGMLIILLIIHHLIYSERKNFKSWGRVIIGILSALLVFAITTPYFFIDYNTALTDIAHEARNLHPGADGLSVIGNFIWYIIKAIPWSISIPQSILAIIGLLLILKRRTKEQLFIFAFITIFIITTGLPPLHWQRWIIPVLPALALIVGDSLITIIEYIAICLKIQTKTQLTLILLAIILVSLPLFRDILIIKKMKSKKSNLLIAQEWLQNYSMKQNRSSSPHSFSKTIYFVLGPEPTIEKYKKQGFHYILINDSMRQIAEETPERYPSLITFYKELDNKTWLINTFDSGSECPHSFGEPFCNNPSVKVYDLSPAQQDG